MAVDDNQVRGALQEGKVMLPGSAGLVVQALDQQGLDLGCSDTPIKPKCRIRTSAGKALEGAMRQGAVMARLLEDPQQAAQGQVRVELTTDRPVSDAGEWATDLLLPWVAAASAWADRIARRRAMDWARCTVLLAGLDLSEDEPQRWCRLRPLAPDLEAAALQAFREGPADAPWVDALIVLPGGESYDALRQELSQRWPRAKVCTADSLAALSSPKGSSHRVGVGQVWFPLVSAEAACFYRVCVAVVPWLPTQGEPPPVELVFEPAPMDGPISFSLNREVSQCLRAWRQEEQPGSVRAWKTVVRLPGELCVATGNSYQLALFLADRMARGREWRGQGTVYATGGVSRVRGDRARVLPVAGTVDGKGGGAGARGGNLKLDAFLNEARAGDTVLLPDDPMWRREVGERLGPERDDGTSFTRAGAAVVFVQRVLP